jgi:hypothetical protein
MGGSSSTPPPAATTSASVPNSAAAMPAATGMSAEYQQKYGYDPYKMAGQYANTAFDSAAKGIMSQRSGYSPDQNAPIMTNSPASYKAAGFTPQTGTSGGGLFSGTNFSNPTQRRIGF